MENSTNLPLVSIILTTYNGEKYLPEQMDSLLQQTYENIEIVAVDDCSSDGTVEILKKYSSQHRNMKVFENESNLGYIKNFDKGCSLCSGSFIALCDQDDYWHKDKVKRMVEGIGHYPMVYCDSFVCDENLHKTGKKISDVVNSQPWRSPLEQAIFCRIYGHATLITKELYHHAHPFITAIPHDWWLSYVATLHGGISYIHEPLVHYRQHSSNVFGAVGGKKSESQKEMEKFEKQNIRERIKAFYEKCPDTFIEEKKVLHQLNQSYRSFSLSNNIRRFLIFLQYRDVFLKVKKHSALHRFLFCFKMFFKIK